MVQFLNVYCNLHHSLFILPILQIFYKIGKYFCFSCCFYCPVLCRMIFSDTIKLYWSSFLILHGFVLFYFVLVFRSKIPSLSKFVNNKLNYYICSYYQPLHYHRYVLLRKLWYPHAMRSVDGNQRY